MTQQLVVRVPAARTNEHSWAMRAMLTDYLGIAFVTETSASSSVEIVNTGRAGSITFPSVWLTLHNGPWIEDYIPDRVSTWINPLELPWDHPGTGSVIPIIFAPQEPGDAILKEDSIHLPWDLAGSAFFMLSRVEEFVSNAVDSHGRFPSAASLAVRENFHHKVVVQAWAEIIWGAIHTLWPDVKRYHLPFRLLPSHDVDWPLSTAGLSLRQLLNMVGGDVLKRKSLTTAFRRGLSGLLPSPRKPAFDPANTFGFLMKESEQRELTSAFYFIPQNTAGPIDGTYDIADPFVRALLSTIHDRGHEIGIHPGYDAGRSPDLIASGSARLRSVLEMLDIPGHALGGRHHFLRWHATESWRHWDDAGLAYDSSVGFADNAGFRAGAAFPYKAFDLETGRELQLLEYPLITMEASVFAAVADTYLGMTDDDGLNLIAGLAHEISRYGGNFTLLWHNSALVTAHQKNLYVRCLNAILEIGQSHG